MLTRLEIRNIKKISFLEFENSNDDRIIEIAGKNAQGKTSILNAIEMALSGRSGLIEHALKDGEDEGYVIVETDRLKAKRRFWQDKKGNTKSELSVWDKTAGGQIVQGPKTFLNDLFGKAFFRPADFIHAKPTERLETLRLALGIDFTDLDNNRTRLFGERIEVGREKKLTEGNLRAYDHLPTSRPESREMNTVLAEIAEIEKLFNRERNEESERAREFKEYDAAKKEYEESLARDGRLKGIAISVRNEINQLKHKLEDIETQIKRNGEQLKSSLKKSEDLEKNVRQGYKVPPGQVNAMATLREELKEISLVEKTNQEFSMRDKINSDLKNLSEKYRQLTKSIDGIDKKKKEILAETKFPIIGMSFGDEDILLNKIPFYSLSTAEKIKIAIGVNAEINNEMKIICLEEGSALDDNSLQEIRELATINDYTIIVESVERNRSDALLIISEGRAK